jgi:hypothetical protein
MTMQVVEPVMLHSSRTVLENEHDGCCRDFPIESLANAEEDPFSVKSPNT